MPKFRKKPVTIEAVQFTGGGAGFDAVLAFVGLHDGVCWHFNHDTVQIPTREGLMTARPGDWIIKGVQGEFYPIKPDIFEQTYEPVE